MRPPFAVVWWGNEEEREAGQRLIFGSQRLFPDTEAGKDESEQIVGSDAVAGDLAKRVKRAAQAGGGEFDVIQKVPGVGFCGRLKVVGEKVETERAHHRRTTWAPG